MATKEMHIKLEIDKPLLAKGIANAIKFEIQEGDIASIKEVMILTKLILEAVTNALTDAAKDMEFLSNFSFDLELHKLVNEEMFLESLIGVVEKITKH